MCVILGLCVISCRVYVLVCLLGLRRSWYSRLCYGNNNNNVDDSNDGDCLVSLFLGAAGECWVTGR